MTACGRKEVPRETGLLAEINAYRKGHGLDPLSGDRALERAAAAHAEEMHGFGYFGHYSPKPDNRTPDMRLHRAGWEKGRAYDELLCNAETPEQAFAAFEKKPRLNERLLDPKFRVAGVGRAGNLWVLLLGR